MCETLLYKYKFSIPAINNIYKLAKSYGEPFEVLKAIGEYSELKALESEVEKLSTKKSELEARRKELETKVQELRGVAEEIKQSTSGLLKPISEETRSGIESITTKFKEAIDTITIKYQESSEKLGDLKAEAGRLEGEMNLARAIQTLIKHPKQAQELPLYYDLIMIRAIIDHCTVKKVNPKVKAGDMISKKYFHIKFYNEVELLDLLLWAQDGITSALEG